jgi:hypothetical protein
MEVPEKWRAYNCGDYFQSPLSETGWWDSEGQCWYIDRAENIREDPLRDFLIIGRPGVDGIEWGYRRGRSGIWAHYPVEGDFRLVADSVSALRGGYGSGRVTV